MILLQKFFVPSSRSIKCYSTLVKKAASSSAFDFENCASEKSRKTAKPYNTIPGPSTWSMIKSFSKKEPEQFSEIFTRFQKVYGDIFRIKGILSKRDTIVLSDPNDFEIVFRTTDAYPIRRGLDALLYYRQNYSKDIYNKWVGLVNEQGESWWDLRHKLNGVMMKPEVGKGYTSAVDEVSMTFVKILHNLRDSNQESPKNFLYYLNVWSLESIAYIMMNFRLGFLSEKPDPMAEKLAQDVKIFFQLSAELEFKPSIWKIFKTPKFHQFIKTLDDIHVTVKKMVDQGLENLKRNVERCDKNSDEKGVLQKLYEIDKNVAILMTVDALIAGVDTTSTAVFSVLYTLATNPDKQKILRSELLKILPEKDSPLTKANMTNLPYLRACIKEAMRLMPVVLGNGRVTGRDIVIKGYQIPKDTDVIMHNQALHTDERNFPNPQTFIPERWLRSEENIRTCNPFAYLPFGFGNRACIGRRFAELEIETLVCRIVRNYQLEWHHPPPKVQFANVNIPKGHLKMKFKEL